MVDFPTGVPDIPSAISGNSLQTMHGAVSQSAGMNRALANLEALATKLGIGASAPGASAAVLRRTAAGQSAWGLVVSGDVDPAFLLPAGGGMRKLADTTLGAASNAVNVPGISQAYSDLLLVGYAMHSATSTNIGMRFAFDAAGTVPDGAANYLWNYINSTNGVLATGTVTADAGISIGAIASSYFTPFICQIPMYCTGTFHRQAYSRTLVLTATTAAGVTTQIVTGMHTTNTGPIKGLQLFVTTGQLAVGSRFMLFGLPGTLG